MKQVLDKFSSSSSSYKKFRPRYPDSLFEKIMEHVKDTNDVLDCGTGNGQATRYLSKNFKSVIGIDISKNQINNAESERNIWYLEGNANATRFKDESFDLITAAQSLHWFDLEAFNQEAIRLLRPGGVIALFGYNLFKVNPEIDEMISYFYYDVIGPYWDDERKILEEEYKNIPFDFEEIPQNEVVDMVVNWDLDQLYGYLHTWSSVKKYMEENPTHDPVDDLFKHLKPVWGEKSKHEVVFPVFLKVGIKK
ncbi:MULTISPECIES: class I SAM-dependent methyltransferase [Flammeovirga]|uniref:Class I SAM-dependent methyltransferase n=1 Tax=Flammeovirga agarivorans TaxID=2726742 RepID=A0A7X8SNM1_9BACT|nr:MULTISPECIES: class I SAM-dependent methyltransferase [Flammeovirga]NLR93539.1 class I SAM-dependent methyltransferase [Flammeovirga agarivorans]